MGLILVLRALLANLGTAGSTLSALRSFLSTLVTISEDRMELIPVLRTLTATDLGTVGSRLSVVKRLTMGWDCSERSIGRLSAPSV